MYLIDAQLWELALVILLDLIIVGFILLAISAWIMSLMAKHSAKLFAEEFNYDKLAKKIANEIQKTKTAPTKPDEKKTNNNTKA